MPTRRSTIAARTWLLAGWLAAMALAPSPSRAQPSAASAGAEQQVLAVDDEYVVAELAHDEAAIRRLVDDRFVFNQANGTTQGKEEFVRHVAKLPMVGQTLRERTVLVEGDIGFVFGTTDLRFASADKPESLTSLRYTCVYVRRDGRWRMLVLQMQPRSTK